MGVDAVGRRPKARTGNQGRGRRDGIESLDLVDGDADSPADRLLPRPTAICYTTASWKHLETRITACCLSSFYQVLQRIRFHWVTTLLQHKYNCCNDLCGVSTTACNRQQWRFLP